MSNMSRWDSAISRANLVGIIGAALLVVGWGATVALTASLSKLQPSEWVSAALFLSGSALPMIGAVLIGWWIWVRSQPKTPEKQSTPQ